MVEPPYIVQRAEVVEDCLVHIECIAKEITVRGDRLQDGVLSGTMPQFGKYGVYYYDRKDSTTYWVAYSELPFEVEVPSYLSSLSVHGDGGEYTAIAPF